VQAAKNVGFEGGGGRLINSTWPFPLTEEEYYAEMLKEDADG
jgi:hypothetical protein